MNLRINLDCNEQGRPDDFVTLEHDGGSVMLTVMEHKTPDENGNRDQLATAFMLPEEARILADALLRFADDCEAAGKEGGE